MNTRLVPLVGALLCALSGVNAQTTPASAAVAAPAVAVTATASVVSNYMFRGQRLNTAAFEPVVELTSGDLTLGAWSTWPFREKDVPDTSAPEIDLYGSYNFALTKEASLAPGFTLYWYPNAPTSAGFYKNTIEPNLAFSYTFQGVRITPKIYYDCVLKGPTYEATVTYAIPLKDIGTELDLTGVFGTYKLDDVANKTSPDVKAWGDYWLLGVAMPFQITKEQKFTLGFAYTEGRNAFTKQGISRKANNPLAVGRGVVTVSYSYAF